MGKQFATRGRSARDTSQWYLRQNIWEVFDNLLGSTSTTIIKLVTITFVDFIIPPPHLTSSHCCWIELVWSAVRFPGEATSSNTSPPKYGPPLWLIPCSMQGLSLEESSWNGNNFLFCNVVWFLWPSSLTWLREIVLLSAACRRCYSAVDCCFVIYTVAWTKFSCLRLFIKNNFSFSSSDIWRVPKAGKFQKKKRKTLCFKLLAHDTA